MLEEDKPRARQLIVLGAVLVFCACIVVLALLPFYVAPLVARYRAGVVTGMMMNVEELHLPWSCVIGAGVRS